MLQAAEMRGGKRTSWTFVTLKISSRCPRLFSRPCCASALPPVSTLKQSTSSSSVSVPLPSSAAAEHSGENTSARCFSSAARSAAAASSSGVPVVRRGLRETLRTTAPMAREPEAAASCIADTESSPTCCPGGSPRLRRRDRT